jgi:ribonuclease HII
LKPNFLLEQKLINSGNNIIAGTDEVGRGSWAGPVTAAAVILDPKKIPMGLNDSKKLPKSIREKLSKEIISCAIEYSIIHIDVKEIDTLNILQASMLAMHEAVEALEINPNHVLIDGNRIPKQLKCPATALVKGDSLSLSIAAASIIAKVARDQLMVGLAQHYPQYAWESNVGYGTKAHIAGLSKYGITPHHRVSFKPIHNML